MSQRRKAARDYYQVQNRARKGQAHNQATNSLDAFHDITRSHLGCDIELSDQLFSHELFNQLFHHEASIPIHQNFQPVACSETTPQGESHPP
jgi:hypothetical protein